MSDRFLIQNMMMKETARGQEDNVGSGGPQAFDARCMPNVPAPKHEYQSRLLDGQLRHKRPLQQ